QFGYIRRELPKLCEIPAVAEAGPVGLDKNQTHSPRATFRVGPNHDDHEIAHLPVGDEGLLARYHKLVALAHGAGADALKVAAGAGFGHRDGADGFARHHPRQPLLLLLRGAVTEQIAATDVVVNGEV